MNRPITQAQFLFGLMAMTFLQLLTYHDNQSVFEQGKRKGADEFFKQLGQEKFYRYCLDDDFTWVDWSFPKRRICFEIKPGVSEPSIGQGTTLYSQ